VPPGHPPLAELLIVPVVVVVLLVVVELWLVLAPLPTALVPVVCAPELALVVDVLVVGPAPPVETSEVSISDPQPMVLLDHATKKEVAIPKT